MSLYALNDVLLPIDELETVIGQGLPNLLNVFVISRFQNDTQITAVDV